MHGGKRRVVVGLTMRDGTKRSDRLRLARRLLASLVVIGLLLWLVPLDDFRHVFERVDPWLALASLAIVLPMATTKAAIFWLAASVQGLSFSFCQMLRIQLASAFYTLVTPGQLGGTVSRWYMMQRPGRQPIEAAAVMLMARYLETALACVVGLALALADPLARHAILSPLLFAALVVAAILLPILLISRPGRAISRRFAGALPDHSWLGPLRHAVPKLRDAGARIRTMGGAVVWRVLALSLLWNGLGILSIAIAAMAVGAEISWVTLGWMRSLLALILVLPLVWGGLGLREASVAAVLQPYGVPPALAIGIGALVSLRNILEAAIGGSVEVASLWHQRGHREQMSEGDATRQAAPVGVVLDGSRPAR